MAVRVPLKMADGELVRTIEELREHFDLASALDYYHDGRLVRWLENGYYDKEADEIKALDQSSDTFRKDLCGILGLGDRVASTQEELDALAHKGVKEIYLCGKCFTLPYDIGDVTYIGLDNPTVTFEKDREIAPGVDIQDVEFDVKDFDNIQETLIAIFNCNHGLWVKVIRGLARQGRADAQVMVGHFYHKGIGVEQDDEEAMKWYRKAAEQGEILAQAVLGESYDNGEGVEKNHEEAVKWFRKAAEQGFPLAQNSLGVHYYNGEGVHQNLVEAAKWFRKAAEQGDVLAQFHLGNCCYHGFGVQQNLAEAVKWYQEAAEQGNENAQCMLGLLYSNGQGVRQDYEEAVKWFRKAAEQGFPIAQYQLGDCYDNGYGIEQDFIEAAKWYRKSAMQGCAEAQYCLGRFYYDGKVVEQNHEEAVKWFRKAAEQGDEDAQAMLKQCDANGIGTDKQYAGQGLMQTINLFRKLLEKSVVVIDDAEEETEKDTP